MSYDPYKYEELRQHIGHDVACVGYGMEGDDPLNVAIECEDCGVVLVDFDRPDASDEADEINRIWDARGDMLDVVYSHGDKIAYQAVIAFLEKHMPLPPRSED